MAASWSPSAAATCAGSVPTAASPRRSRACPRSPRAARAACWGRARAPDFSSSRRIYLTYAEPGEDGTPGTAAAYATLDGDALSGLTVIYRQEPKVDAEYHYGSRLAFDDEGHVFISQGDRSFKPMA